MFVIAASDDRPRLRLGLGGRDQGINSGSIAAAGSLKYLWCASRVRVNWNWSDLSTTGLG
ncbi:hypothetical protein L873DRAFT_1800631 [Choiromyces venosus 120613-1]|uniref:Uncharacterized protein n=1 Tax=Choiromyces venosus 120613-1 TaxID=1336337 RepID=A0A3N4JYU9_9PEZI|nr:hypothetical protein L873DRAFT_1800631 [Choiromyces venosus 120613-1]